MTATLTPRTTTRFDQVDLDESGQQRLGLLFAVRQHLGT